MFSGQVTWQLAVLVAVVIENCAVPVLLSVFESAVVLEAVADVS
jgi:hypothetical protein